MRRPTQNAVIVVVAEVGARHSNRNDAKSQRHFMVRPGDSCNTLRLLCDDGVAEGMLDGDGIRSTLGSEHSAVPVCPMKGYDCQYGETKQPHRHTPFNV